MADKLSDRQYVAICLTIMLHATAMPVYAQEDDATEDNDTKELEEVVVMADDVSRINKSAFNVVAISSDGMMNSTKSLSDALAKIPGLKLRETGGVGSDMTLTLDGFSSKHVKVFIDGVPQEGVGEAFGLNNIPVTYAD